jgi:hypothetical protein
MSDDKFSTDFTLWLAESMNDIIIHHVRFQSSERSQLTKKATTIIIRQQQLQHDKLIGSHFH